MLSRVAENIFWMSRYMERTNFHLRSLQSQYLAYQNGIEEESWEALCQEYQLQLSIENQRISQILSKIVFDTQIDSSIINNVFRARENARSAQDHITKELWQCLNDYHHMMNNSELRKELLQYDPISVFDVLIKQGMIYYGVVDSSMSRDDGFYFLKLGKQIERALQCLYYLHKQLIVHGENQALEDNTSWKYLLDTLSGFEYYNRQSVGNLDSQLIYNQIIYETHFPNSVLYSLGQIKRFTEHLQYGSKEEANEKIAFEVGKTIAFVQFSEKIKTYDQKIEFLKKTEKMIYGIIQVFNSNYFGLNY